jgi:hypothetical protein
MSGLLLKSGIIEIKAVPAQLCSKQWSDIFAQDAGIERGEDGWNFLSTSVSYW